MEINSGIIASGGLMLHACRLRDAAAQLKPERGCSAASARAMTWRERAGAVA